MDTQKQKTIRHKRRRINIRKRILGTAERPRMCIFRSLNHIYVQVIDDLEGKTLASASTRDKDVSVEKGANKAAAAIVGAKIAEKAKAAGVTKVKFDRGGFRFHGRVKALADAARKAGLEF